VNIHAETVFSDKCVNSARYGLVFVRPDLMVRLILPLFQDIQESVREQVVVVLTIICYGFPRFLDEHPGVTALSLSS
jgi:hypothetical protein